MSARLRALSPAVMERALAVWKQELANGLTPEGALVLVLAETLPVHAHELAEKIRSRFDGSIIDDIREQDADLIDPEVQQ